MNEDEHIWVEYITPRFKKFFKDWGIDKEYEWIPDQSPNVKLSKKVMRIMFNPDVLVEIAKHADELRIGRDPAKMHPLLRDKVYEMTNLIEKEKWKMKKKYDEKIKLLYQELSNPKKGDKR